MVNISEVKGNTRENRTAAHTHIKGLGLRQDGTAEKGANGFVGQTDAREVRQIYLPPTLAATLLPCLTRSLLGMRRGCRSHKIQEDVWKGSTSSRWTGYWQDSPCAGSITGTGDQGAVLSYSGKRNLLDRSQEDRGVDGELPESYW
jgi:hypothetical protein